MNITLTDFNFGDLMILITSVNIVINFFSLLFYEEYKSLKKTKKGEK